MLRAFFHFHGEATLRDERGERHPDLASAVATARRIVRELVGEAIRAGEPIHAAHRIEVTDAGGAVQAVIRFGDVIDLRT